MLFLDADGIADPDADLLMLLIKYLGGKAHGAQAGMDQPQQVEDP